MNHPDQIIHDSPTTMRSKFTVAVQVRRGLLWHKLLWEIHDLREASSHGDSRLWYDIETREECIGLMLAVDAGNELMVTEVK